MTTVAATHTPANSADLEMECWECQAKVRLYDMVFCTQCGMNMTCRDCTQNCPTCDANVCSDCWHEGDVDAFDTREGCLQCIETHT